MHSTLGFFDLEHLQMNYDNGYLWRNIRILRKRFERVVIDEASMLNRPMFELLYKACKEEDMGLVLSGDFLQLAPVNKDTNDPLWLFESPMFKEFTVLRLPTQYRQTDKNFLNALNYLRRGDGVSALDLLQKAGVTFWDFDQTDNEALVRYYIDYEFPGTMLVATNDCKDAINSTRYRRLKVDEFVFEMARTGDWKVADRKRWEDIPRHVKLKVGTRVMITRNAYDEDGTMIHANGDTGIVQKIDNQGVVVLRDDGDKVLVRRLKEDNGIRTKVRDTVKPYVLREPTAGIVFMPLTQAWATTVHKAQGLTFNHPVCVDIFGNEKPSGNFFGHPAMLYVAISRVRNPKDLTIVGANSLSQSQSGLTLLEANCNMDGKCRRWL